MTKKVNRNGIRIFGKVRRSRTYVPEMRTNRADKLRFRQLAFDETNGHCYYCGKILTLQTMTLDHYIPKIAGGLDQPSNIVAACSPCNELKGSMSPDKFAQTLGVSRFYGE